jgi:hypothetical protein
MPINKPRPLTSSKRSGYSAARRSTPAFRYLPLAAA